MSPRKKTAATTASTASTAPTTPKRKRGSDPATIAALRAKARGRKLDQKAEYREKGINGQRRERTPEERARISATLKRHWAERGSQRNTDWYEPFFAEFCRNGGVLYKALNAAGFHLNNNGSGDGRAWLAYKRAMTEDAEFQAAMEIARAVIEGMAWEAAWEEGVTGVTKNVYHQGEVVGQERTRDTKMTQFVLKSINPDKYSERERIANKGLRAFGDLEERRKMLIAAAQDRVAAFLPPGEVIDAEAVE